jgi:hypothetical protein
MTDNFLKRKNVDNIYGYIKNTVFDKTHINLDSNPKYRNMLKKMMALVYKRQGTSASTLRELNDVAIQKTGPYLLNEVYRNQNLTINDINVNKQQKLPENRNSISPLPISTEDVSGSALSSTQLKTNQSILDSLFADSPQNTTPENGNNGDFYSRLSEMEKNRGYDDGTHIKDVVKTPQEQEQEWRKNIEIADKKADDEAKSRHLKPQTEQILSVIGQDNEPAIDHNFSNHNQLDPQFNQSNANSLSSINEFQNIQHDVIDSSNINRIGLEINELDEEDEHKKDKINNDIVFDEGATTLEKNTMIMSKLANMINGLNNVLGVNETDDKLYGDENVRVGQETEDKIFTIMLDTGTGISPLVTSATPNVYWDTVTYDLKDTLNFSTDVDVFLESLTINNPALAGNNNLYLVIDFSFINERNISNNSNFRNKFAIPNENTTTTGDNQIMKYHLKSNYIGRLSGQDKGSIKTITAQFTNEAGESVSELIEVSDQAGNTYSVATANMKASTTLNVTTINDVGEALHVDDELYTKNGRSIGTIATISDTDTVTLDSTPNVNLALNDKLYYKIGRTPVRITSATANGTTSAITVNLYGSTITSAIINSYNITARVVDSTSGEIQNRGTIIYLSDGTLVGEVTAVADNTITFGDGLENTVAAQAILYIKTNQVVFSSNTKVNRIIMELIFRERKKSIITSN